MSKPTLDITITPDGQVIGQVQDVAGPGCEKLLDWINDLGQVTVDRRTPDFYRLQQVAAGGRQTAGGRG